MSAADEILAMQAESSTRHQTAADEILAMQRADASQSHTIGGYRISAAKSTAPIHFGTHAGLGVYDIGESEAKRQGKTLDEIAQDLASQGFIAAVRRRGQKNITSNHIHFADPQQAPKEAQRLANQRASGNTGVYLAGESWATGVRKREATRVLSVPQIVKPAPKRAITKTPAPKPSFAEQIGAQARPPTAPLAAEILEDVTPEPLAMPPPSAAHRAFQEAMPAAPVMSPEEELGPERMNELIELAHQYADRPEMIDLSRFEPAEASFLADQIAAAQRVGKPLGGYETLHQVLTAPAKLLGKAGEALGEVMTTGVESAATKIALPGVEVEGGPAVRLPETLRKTVKNAAGLVPYVMPVVGQMAMAAQAPALVMPDPQTGVPGAVGMVTEAAKRFADIPGAIREGQLPNLVFDLWMVGHFGAKGIGKVGERLTREALTPPKMAPDVGTSFTRRPITTEAAMALAEGRFPADTTLDSLEAARDYYTSARDAMRGYGPEDAAAVARDMFKSTPEKVGRRLDELTQRLDEAHAEELRYAEAEAGREAYYEAGRAVEAEEWGNVPIPAAKPIPGLSVQTGTIKSGPRKGDPAWSKSGVTGYSIEDVAGNMGVDVTDARAYDAFIADASRRIKENAPHDRKSRVVDPSGRTVTRDFGELTGSTITRAEFDALVRSTGGALKRDRLPAIGKRAVKTEAVPVEVAAPPAEVPVVTKTEVAPEVPGVSAEKTAAIEDAIATAEKTGFVVIMDSPAASGQGGIGLRRVGPNGQELHIDPMFGTRDNPVVNPAGTTHDLEYVIRHETAHAMLDGPGSEPRSKIAVPQDVPDATTVAGQLRLAPSDPRAPKIASEAEQFVASRYGTSRTPEDMQYARRVDEQAADLLATYMSDPEAFAKRAPTIAEVIRENFASAKHPDLAAKYGKGEPAAVEPAGPVGGLYEGEPLSAHEAHYARAQERVKALREKAKAEKSGVGPVHQALQEAQGNAKAKGMRLAAARKALSAQPAPIVIGGKTAAEAKAVRARVKAGKTEAAPEAPGAEPARPTKTPPRQPSGMAAKPPAKPPAPPTAGAAPPAPTPPEPGGPKMKVRSPRDMVLTLSEAVETPMRQGRFRGPFAGVHKWWANVSRARNMYSVTTAAHEFGHSLSTRFGWTKKPNYALKHELKRFGDPADLGPNSSWKPAQGEVRQMEEGVAEAIRHYIEDPETLRREAPKFHGMLEEALGTMGALDAFRKVQGEWKAWKDAPAWEKMRLLTDYSGEVERAARPKRWKGFRATYVDGTFPIRALVEKATGKPFEEALKPSENPAMLARVVRGAHGHGKQLVQHGWDEVPSLVSAFEKFSSEAEYTAFCDYARARRLHAYGKAGRSTSGFTPEELQQIIDHHGSPKMVEAFGKIEKFFDHLLDLRVESGEISAEGAAKMRKTGDYIPMDRIMEAGVGESVAQQGPSGTTRGLANQRTDIKGYHGSARPFRPWLEVAIEDAYRVTQRLANLKAMRALKDFAAKHPEAGQVFEEIAPPIQAQRIIDDAIAAIAQRDGIPIDEARAYVEANYPAELFDLTLWKAPQRLTSGMEADNIVFIPEKGKPKFYQVGDPALYGALVHLTPPMRSAMLQVMAAPAQLLHTGVVVSPSFLWYNNLIRDAMQAYLVTEGYWPGYSTGKGVRKALARKPGRMQELWMRYGGELGGTAALDRTATRQRAARVGTSGKKVKGVITDPKEAMVAIGDGIKAYRDASESSNRLEVFEIEYKRARNEHPDWSEEDCAIYGAYKSRDTCDFALAGQSRLCAEATAMVPFLRGATSGLAKFSHEIARNPVRVMKRGAPIALMTGILYSMNRNNPNYTALDEWERAQYWHFPIKGGGEFIRIPKPFEWGWVFGTMVERGLRAELDKDPHAMDNWTADLSNFIPPYLPQAASVPLGLYSNRDPYFGSQIVSQWQLENLRPEDQATRATSPTMKAIGKKIGVSPRKTEWAVQRSAGWAGETALTMMDWATSPLTGEKPQRAIKTPLYTAITHPNPYPSLVDVMTLEQDRLNRDLNSAMLPVKRQEPGNPNDRAKKYGYRGLAELKAKKTLIDKQIELHYKLVDRFYDATTDDQRRKVRTEIQTHARAALKMIGKDYAPTFAEGRRRALTH